MTLCIAAICNNPPGSSSKGLVFCTDAQFSQGGASAEFSIKWQWIMHPRWLALMAGNVAGSKHLIQDLKASLQDKPLDHETAFNDIEKAVERYAEKRIENYIRRTLGVAPSEFFTSVEPNLTETLKYEMLNYMAHPPEDEHCWLTIAGFADKRPRLFLVNPDFSVREETNFSIIGSGADFARPALLRLHQHEGRSQGVTIYNVFEAKRLAEINPDVGKQLTNIATMSLSDDGDVKVSVLNDEGNKTAQEIFSKYGPKKLDYAPDFTKHLT